MKKSLIALAIASAVSAPAFAATSNVDVYGVMNLSLNFVDPGTSSPLGLIETSSSTSLSSVGSRIGFKGVEDLGGGGLKAIWQIETGFNAEEVSGTIGSRNTFVGLQGGWGTVLMGNHDTPMKLLGRSVDNFADTLADSRNILGAVATGQNLYDLRTKNTIAYISPAFSGVTVAVAYITDWSANTAATFPTVPVTTTGAVYPLGTNGLDNNNTDAYSINAVWNAGAIMIGGGYEQQNLGNAGSQDIWRLVGGFNIAGFKLGAEYSQASSDVALFTNDSYGLFATWTIGNWAIKGNYLNVSDSDATLLGVSANDGADQWTLGVDYALSKRTTLYAFYAAVSNDTTGAYGLGTGAAASDQTSGLGTAGSDPSTFSVGLKHAF